jgi:hypothetical protein
MSAAAMSALRATSSGCSTNPIAVAEVHLHSLAPDQPLATIEAFSMFVGVESSAQLRCGRELEQGSRGRWSTGFSDPGLAS